MTFFPNSGNIPKLRFFQFNNEWKNEKLGNLMTFKVTNSYSRDNLNYESGAVKNIHYGDIHTKFQTLFDLEKENVPYINEDISLSRISEDFYCQEGDIIFADASEDLNDVGKSIEITNLNDEKLLSGLHTLLARPQEDIFFKGFLGYLLKSNNVRNQIKREAQGSKVLSINVGRISNIHLPFPSILEQQKISEFLSLLDKRILYSMKIIEKLETLMKVSRINIFSQKLRFKNEQGYDFPDWKKLKLGKIGNFQTSSIDKLSKENENEVYLVNYMNVYRHEDINSSTIKSFQKVTAKEQQITSCNLKKGDILFTPSSETPNDIGHSVVISENLENTVFSYHLMRFRPKIEIDILYSHYFCNVPIVLSQLSKFATGSTRFTISVKSFSDVEISLPSLLEQKVIGKFLSLVENKIDTEKQILEKLELQKKFFLSNLFV